MEPIVKQKRHNRFIWILKTEPVVRNAVITLLFALVTAFGFDISTELKASIIGVFAAIFAGITRQEVTPTVKLQEDTKPGFDQRLNP